MMEIRSIEKYILDEIKKQKTLCFPLIDSENTSKTIELAKKLEQLGASAILVGGSSTSDQIELSNFVTELKKNVKIPVILFPSNIAVMYALAALYMGMRFLYLEAGSGASQNIPPEMVSTVKKFYKGILIVGGGINSAETAKKISDAGADIIVIGTMIEREKDWESEFVNIIKALR